MRQTRLLVLVVMAAFPAAASPQGLPVGPEFLVNTYTTSDQVLPSVAAAASGDFVIVWQSYLQDGFISVFGQRFSAGGAPLGPEFRVNADTANAHIRPSVAADAAGNFVVAWTSFVLPSTPVAIMARRYASSGAPLTGEFRVDTYTTGQHDEAAVAVDGAGGFIVVWVADGEDGSSRGVFGQRYAASGAALGPEFRANTDTIGPQTLPAVTADAAGDFVVVWQGTGSSYDVFGQRYSAPGSPLGRQFQVNTSTILNQDFASVAADPAGNFVVAWHSQFPYQIVGRRYAASGVPLTGEFVASTTTVGDVSNTSIGMDSVGDFVVVWYGGSGPEDAFGRRYDASGAALGPEFRVNTYTTDRQIVPAVSADAPGHFVVVWMSHDQDGAGYGIYGQRYSLIVPVELTRFQVE